MNEDRLQPPQQGATRRTLRFAGLLILGAGFALLAIGVGSFFCSFGTFEPPRYFWCVFLAMPLMFAGGVMTVFGFLGAFQRYVAAETAPVAKDVVNYMGENTQPGVKSLAKAVTEGIKEGLSGDPGSAPSDRKPTAGMPG